MSTKGRVHLSIAKDLSLWYAGIGKCGLALPGLNEYTTDPAKVTCPHCIKVVKRPAEHRDMRKL